MAVMTLRQLVQHQPHGFARRRRTPKPVRVSRANELWYKTQLRAIAGRLKALTAEHLVPILQREAGRAHDSPLEDEINAAIGRIAAQLGGLDSLAQRLATEALMRNLRAVDDGLVRNIKNAVGIDISNVLSKDSRLAQAMAKAERANVDLIKSLPEQYLDRVGEMVRENFTAGVRFDNLVEKVQALGDVTESRATLIARDQTSKMNGAFNEARQQSLGITRYRWQGANDERERDTHRENNGQTFRWDSPPDTGHPGEDYQCRCTAIPIFDFEEE